MNKTVTIFGSSIPKPGDEEYETAYKLGKMLGGKNLNVCTGGYRGIMDASSKGATEAGVEAFGITVDMFKARPSSYLTKEIKCASLFERIDKLIAHGDAFVILTGGTGTMLELAVVWEYLNKGLLDNKPVAVHGKMWKEIVDVMEKRITVEKRRSGLIKCCDSIDELANYIISSLEGC